MTATTKQDKKVHLGRNLRRVREILDVKQESLAIDLGVSQQTVSSMEQREEIEPETLEKVARALKVPVDIIKNFSEDVIMWNIQHNYESASSNNNNIDRPNNFHQQCTFNPLDKVVELYERMLQLEREKVVLEREKAEMLERMLKEKK